MMKNDEESVNGAANRSVASTARRGFSERHQRQRVIWHRLRRGENGGMARQKARQPASYGVAASKIVLIGGIIESQRSAATERSASRRAWRHTRAHLPHLIQMRRRCVVGNMKIMKNNQRHRRNESGARQRRWRGGENENHKHGGKMAWRKAYRRSVSAAKIE
jgi:hypothetical protein